MLHLFTCFYDLYMFHSAIMQESLCQHYPTVIIVGDSRFALEQ